MNKFLINAVSIKPYSLHTEFASRCQAGIIAPGSDLYDIGVFTK
jgi:hypothetical protein